MTPKSELASNITAAALFRYIEAVRPTLLIDEADAFVKDNEELRGILNSGHTKVAANVIRNVEVNGEHKPRRFSTWAPKAIATIAGSPTHSKTAPSSSRCSASRAMQRSSACGDATPRSSNRCVVRPREWAADNFDKLVDPDRAVPEAPE